MDDSKRSNAKTAKKNGSGKDRADTSKQAENGNPIKKARHILHRTATEEDYVKLQNWNVGTFHRASTVPATESPDGEDKSQENPPHCPAELVKALRKQGVRVKLPGPLEERLQNDMMMEGWLGKHPEKK